MNPSERESTPTNEVLQIVSGIQFKPFENVNGFYTKSDFEKDHEVPWNDLCDLYLRRKFSFGGIEGYIDAISENPSYQNLPHQNPHGEAKFDIEIGYDEEGNEFGIYHELPAILRFCFFLKSPRDFVALSNTGITFFDQETKYILIQTHAQKTSEILYSLEMNQPYAIPERFFSEREAFIKTLKNYKNGDASITFNSRLIWFPPKIEDLKKIALMFERDDDRRGDRNEIVPSPPSLKERELVTV